jgi:hypothetical protein
VGATEDGKPAAISRANAHTPASQGSADQAERPGDIRRGQTRLANTKTNKARPALKA